MSRNKAFDRFKQICCHMDNIFATKLRISIFKAGCLYHTTAEKACMSNDSEQIYVQFGGLLMLSNSKDKSESTNHI